MGGNANPVKVVKKAVSTATSVAKQVVAPVVKLAEPVVTPVVKAATQVVSAVPIVGEPAAKAINQVTDAVGVTTPAPPPSAAPVEQAVAGDSTSETITNPQVALTGKAGEAPGQSGGDVEVKKGAGRLNKNVQRSRAQFRTPSANTGAAGSSIRI